MKCKSCGKEIAENISICPNCGFDLEAFGKKQKVIIYEDPEVETSEKASLIDRPILAFIFGILSVISSILFVTSPNIVVLYLAMLISFTYLTFRNASKPGKVKLRPFADVGKVFAYFAIGFLIFKIVFDLLGDLFF